MDVILAELQEVYLVAQFTAVTGPLAARAEAARPREAEEYHERKDVEKEHHHLVQDQARGSRVPLNPATLFIFPINVPGLVFHGPVVVDGDELGVRDETEEYERLEQHDDALLVLEIL